MDSGQLYDAVIVGGGLAGTTVAAELALLGPRHLRVLLVEAAEPGPGRAYAPASERVYMNGTARAMSAVAGDKQHLVRWLRTEPEQSLIPRRVYGRYLTDRFHEAVAGRSGFEVARTEIVDIFSQDDAFTVVDARGGERSARNVVLALGNFLPDYSFLPEALYRHPGFVADPWRFNPGTGFADNMHGEIAIVGSGLTALDAVALLDEQGFSGRLHLVSRHGLLPCIENPFAHALDLDALALDTQTPYALLRSLRAAARRHCEAGGDWRDVVESIRSISPDVWSAWSLRERRRFLRHVQPFWAIHRYRVPPQTAAVCSRLRREGRLVRHRGRIDEASETADGRLRVRIVHATGITSLVVSGAINCTGPNGDYTRVRHPLVQNLLRRGIIRPDVLSLGMDATTDLRVIDREGRRNERLFTLGPPLRGLRYETTAVPETREQAALVARWIVEALPEQRLEAAS